MKGTPLGGGQHRGGLGFRDPEAERRVLGQSSADSGQEVTAISVEDVVVSPYQPRLVFNLKALKSLADSIALVGQTTPIIVRVVAGKYELVAGERRWRAHKLLNKQKINAIVRDLSDHEAQIMATAENDAQEDISEFERGLSYKALLDSQAAKSQLELGKLIGRSSSTISRCLAYFKLPENILDIFRKNPEKVIGVKYVSRLAEYSYTHEEIALQGVMKIVEGESQSAAMKWIAQEISRKENKDPQLSQEFGANIEKAAVSGRNVVLTVLDGQDPMKLLKALSNKDILEKIQQYIDETEDV